MRIGIFGGTFDPVHMGHLILAEQCRTQASLDQVWFLPAAHPPHKADWLCIHRNEGAWTDTGEPYWGGLQMDRGFMTTYAPRSLLRRGWADRWTPIEQMWVAERAFRSGRGFYPWPNTARMCGLI